MIRNPSRIGMAFIEDLFPVQIGQIPDCITLSLLVNVKIRILLSTVIIVREKEVPVLVIVTSVHLVILTKIIPLQQIATDIKGKSFAQAFGLDFNHRTLLRVITYPRIRHQSDRLNLVDSQIVQFGLVCHFSAIDIIGRKTSTNHFYVLTTFLNARYLAKQIIQCSLSGKNRIRHISRNAFPIQFERFSVGSNLHSFKFGLCQFHFNYRQCEIRIDLYIPIQCLITQIRIADDIITSSKRCAIYPARVGYRSGDECTVCLIQKRDIYHRHHRIFRIDDCSFNQMLTINRQYN